MTTIYYNGFHASKGTNNVHQFWGDIHNLSVRADKLIHSFEDLKDVVERFEADRNQFDWISYASHPKSYKANRKYSVMYETTKEFYVMVFKYQGKQYKVRTRSITTTWKIEKNADEILSHVRQTVRCLVDDESDEVVGEAEVLSETDMLNEYFM